MRTAGGLGVAKEAYVGSALDVGTTVAVGTDATVAGNVIVVDASDNLRVVVGEAKAAFGGTARLWMLCSWHWC